jgi:hypothetical protein
MPKHKAKAKKLEQIENPEELELEGSDDYASEEEMKNWADRVNSSIKLRKTKMVKTYGFSREDFASEYEQNLGLDFSMRFMDECYPEEFYRWPMEKQAQLANAEVRSPVLHKAGWSMRDVNTYGDTILTILRLIIFVRTNAEMMANLAYQALYSEDGGSSQRAYAVYYIAIWLARVYQPRPLMYGMVFLFITWLFLPVTLWYPLYITVFYVSLLGFLWCLLHLNLQFGEYRRKLQAMERGHWGDITMEDARNLEGEKKRVFELIQMRVWSARIDLAKHGDSLKEKAK